MDQLSADEQDNLRKCNSERLRSMAARTGQMGEDDIAAMDRPALLQAAAQDLLSKKELPKDSAIQIDSGRSVQIRDMEIQLELKRIDMENKKMEMEIEMERRRMEMDHEFRMAQIDRGRREEGGAERAAEPRIGNVTERVETLADWIKKYGSALKQVVTPMTDDASELPQFFENIESIFSTFEIPNDLRAKLLLPFLSNKARTLTARLSAEELNNYDSLKDLLLSEFKLTPREYKTRFESAIKRVDETHILFAARLRNNLRYYLRSRDVGNDYEKLCNLLIADKLKSCLSSGPLNYVLTLEGDNWFEPKRIAELADTSVITVVLRVRELLVVQTLQVTDNTVRVRDLLITGVDEMGDLTRDRRMDRIVGRLV